MKNTQIEMNVIQIKNIALGGLLTLLAACSSGGVYNNVACGAHPSSVCVQKKMPKKDKVNLGAEALFQFDKYSENSLLAKGRQQLYTLAQKLTNNYVEINRITLVGHTDRLGSEAYNNALGLNRARTVRTYLQSHGVNANIVAETAGESQPVTNGCYGVSPRKQLTACLQPDRRVVVQVLGVKRVEQCNDNKVNLSN